MDHDAYSVGLVDRKVRPPLEIADVETTGEMVRTTVRPTDAGERHTVAASHQAARQRIQGRDVVIVLHAGPARVERQPAREHILRGDRGAVRDVVIIVDEHREGEIAREAACEAHPIGEAVTHPAPAAAAAEVLLARSGEDEPSLAG